MNELNSKIKIKNQAAKYKNKALQNVFLLQYNSKEQSMFKKRNIYD